MRASLILLSLNCVLLMASPLRGAAQEQPRDQVDVAIGGTRLWQLAVWSEGRADSRRVMARRLDERGRPRAGPSGTPFELAPAIAPDGRKADQRWPVLVNGILTWSERLPGAADYDVFLQRLSANARPDRAPILVAGGPGNQTHAEIGGTCGSILVIWADDRYDDGDIYGRWFNAKSLEARGPAFQVLESPGWASEPAVDNLSRRDRHQILIYYSDDRSGNQDIYVTTISDRFLTPPSDPTAEQQPVITGPLDEHSPEVIGSPGLLVWTVDDPQTGPDLWFRRFYDNGLPRGGPQRLLQADGSQDRAAAVAWATPDGEPSWLVAWQDDRLGSWDLLATTAPAGGTWTRLLPPWVLAGD